MTQEEISGEADLTHATSTLRRGAGRPTRAQAEARHEELLGITRHALHATEWSCPMAGLSFRAPLPRDWAALMGKAGLDPKWLR